MPLISYLDYESLPIEPKLRWVKLRDLVEQRLEAVADSSTGVRDSDLVDYASTLSAAADELGVGVLAEPRRANLGEDFADFRADVVRLATRLSLQTSTMNLKTSVVLKTTTKQKIYAQISRLRDMIASSDLAPKHKKKLEDRLDELSGLVAASRMDMGLFMKATAMFCAAWYALGEATAILADGPEAISTIAMLIGVDKEAEDEEQRLLDADSEPLKLQDLRQDDIPF